MIPEQLSLVRFRSPTDLFDRLFPFSRRPSSVFQSYRDQGSQYPKLLSRSHVHHIPWPIRLLTLAKLDEAYFVADGLKAKQCGETYRSL
jgi:hypothetical protein